MSWKSEDGEGEFTLHLMETSSTCPLVGVALLQCTAIKKEQCVAWSLIDGVVGVKEEKSVTSISGRLCVYQ